MSSIIQSALKILIDTDSLTINGFGVLYKTKKASYVHPITKEVAPPQKVLNFKKDTTQTCEKLGKLYAQENNITEIEAQERIANWVKDINEQLSSYKHAKIEGLGSIKQKHDDTFELILQEGVVFDKEFFGLASFTINTSPIHNEMEDNNLTNNELDNTNVETAEQLNEETPKKKKRAWIWILIILLIIAALVFVGYFFQDEIKEFFQASDVDEEMVINKDNDVDVDESIGETATALVDDMEEDFFEEDFVEEEEVVAEPVYAEPAPAPAQRTYTPAPVDLSSIVYAPQNGQKFYVIAGSFKSLNNAARQVEQLKKQGYNNPVVIGKNQEGLIRVAYKQGFDTERAARDFADELYENKGEFPWIFKY